MTKLHRARFRLNGEEERLGIGCMRVINELYTTRLGWAEPLVLITRPAKSYDDEGGF